MGFSRQEYWSGVPLPSPIPFSSGPHFVRTLHHDPSILGGPTWAWLMVSLSQTKLWSMWSDWLVFCDCGFHSDCPLLEKVKRLMEASWWEILTEGLIRSCFDRVISSPPLTEGHLQVKPLSQHNIISLNLEDRAACVKRGYCDRRIDNKIFGYLGHHFNYWYSPCICFISKVLNYILNTFTVKDYLNTIAFKSFFICLFVTVLVFHCFWVSSSCSEQGLTL